LDPWKDGVELHKRLAYVPSDVSFWENMTGGEVIDLIGRLRGKADPARRKELIGRFELDVSKKCKTYSKGNRQKVALIAALVSDVELYILDEPTTGLDPLMETVFKKCVQEMRQQGKTVFLSSHILSEVESLCDRIGIIRGGRLVKSGEMTEIHTLIEASDPPTLEGFFLQYYESGDAL
jgi:ABC-2 type transport system ATP-binding protein